MAEEEPEAPAIQPIWSNDSESVPEVYINRFFINEGASDVSIALGSEYREAGRLSRLCRLRVMMTHNQFLQFAEDVRKEAEFLRLLYHGEPSSLRDVTQDEYNDAVSEIYFGDLETYDESANRQF